MECHEEGEDCCLRLYHGERNFYNAAAAQCEPVVGNCAPPEEYDLASNRCVDLSDEVYRTLRGSATQATAAEEVPTTSTPATTWATNGTADSKSSGPLLPVEGWTMMEGDLVLALVASGTLCCCLWQLVKCCWRRRQQWHERHQPDGGIVLPVGRPTWACTPDRSALPSLRGEQVLPAAPLRVPPMSRLVATPHAPGAWPREAESYRSFCIDPGPRDAPTVIDRPLMVRCTQLGVDGRQVFPRAPGHHPSRQHSTEGKARDRKQFRVASWHRKAKRPRPEKKYQLDKDASL